MKRLFAVLLLVVMAATAAVAESPEAVMTEEAQRVSGDYTYEVLEDGTAKVVKYNGSTDFVVIPATLDDYAVTVIGKDAFSVCNAKAVTVPEGVIKLEEAAFRYAQMTRLTLPDSLTACEGAFEGCWKLDTVVLSDTNTVLKVENRALIDTREQCLLTILWGKYGAMPFNQTEYKVPDGIRSIGNYAFEANDVIQTVALPDTVSRIGLSGFHSSDGLKTVSFYESAVGSDAERTGFTLGKSAFSGCEALESITLPADCTKIGDYAFSRCKALESIVLPAGCTEIGNGAFEKCVSLKDCPLPAALESIGYFAFDGCESLEEAILPDGIKTIGFNAFEGCVNLKKLRLPGSLEKVGSDAFKDCTRLQTMRTGINIADNMCSGMTGLTSVEITEGVTSIGRNAFKGCTALETVTLPASLMEIDATAFDGCSVSLVVPANSYAEQYAIYYNIPYTIAE